METVKTEAAPELYAALEGLLRAVRAEAGGETWRYTKHPDVIRAKAALANAVTT